LQLAGCTQVDDQTPCVPPRHSCGGRFDRPRQHDDHRGTGADHHCGRPCDGDRRPGLLPTSDAGPRPDAYHDHDNSSATWPGRERPSLLADPNLDDRHDEHHLDDELSLLRRPIP
jgi:hypothetical protein